MASVLPTTVWWMPPSHRRALLTWGNENRIEARLVASKGRLELTWTNKHLTLLSKEDGSYEWVDPFDVRVAETRLLDEAAAVGSPNGVDCGNLLIRGDSLQALRSLRRLPEYATHIAGRVKLVYIDPPFNTGQAFTNYDDALEHSVWLTMMRDRLVEMKHLLASNGSIWVHLDDAENHHARVLLDEVFGAANFVGTIIWQKADSPRNSARYFSTDHDYIHIYARRADTWRPNRLPRTAEVDKKYTNPDNDPRGRWFGDNLRANKPYSLGQYEVVGPSGKMFSVPPGRFWRISKELFEELDADGQIWWGKDGDAFPTIKRYLSAVGDLVPRTLWQHTEVGSNRSSKNEIKLLFPGTEPFATPKPEALMERILAIATDPGDMVLDCFAGSGTTAAVAHKMGRRWVVMERELSTVATFARPRLEKVVTGADPGGITNSVGWNGGGGFRVLDVAASMYEIDETGQVFLSQQVTNGRFADVVRAQLSYMAEDEPPFCGRRGRTRLAVIDGVAGETETRHLVAALSAGERMVLVAKGVDAAVEPLLAELSPGSRIRKVPRDILCSSGRIIH